MRTMEPLLLFGMDQRCVSALLLQAYSKNTRLCLIDHVSMRLISVFSLLLFSKLHLKFIFQDNFMQHLSRAECLQYLKLVIYHFLYSVRHDFYTSFKGEDMDKGATNVL